MSILCECGCGEIVKNRFVSGHNSRDKNLTKEHIEKLIKCNKDRVWTDKQKVKLMLWKNMQVNKVGIFPLGQKMIYLKR